MTLTEIISRIRADIAARLGQAPQSRSVVGVLSMALAGLAHMLYARISDFERQAIPTTATRQLDRWGEVWGINRHAAAPARGMVEFTGVGAPDIGAVLTGPSGIRYHVTAVPSPGEAEIEALEGGADGNLPGPAELTFEAVWPNVSPTAESDFGLSGGADEEGDDSLRARILARIQNPPSVGSAADYERWALEVPWVGRAWCIPLIYGAGTVGVGVLRRGAGDIIPGGAEIAEVQAYIDERRPVTANVTVFAPTPAAVDITLSVSPDTPAVRAAAEAELADAFLARAAVGRPMRLSWISAAVSAAPGEDHHEIIYPSTDIPMGPLDLPVLGDIAWS